MQKYESKIEEIWLNRDLINKNSDQAKNIRQILEEIIAALNEGKIRVCEKENGIWRVNFWIKKSILLYFKFTNAIIYSGDSTKWYDKIPPKFHGDIDVSTFDQLNQRIVPGAFVRNGCYIGRNVVVMPSFINIGAYVDDASMIDSWATIGSCAQIGKNCHISGGTGIGGVLEPLQSAPVIIEDNCFVGARSEIVEGVIVEEGSVISMGVFIGASTKIIYRDTGRVIYGKVPAYSVVVPGSAPSSDPSKPSLYCAVIIKQVDQKTRNKVSINELLRS